MNKRHREAHLNNSPALLIDSEGLLDQARLQLSPNRDLRPQSATIDLAVIHGISLPAGKFGGEAISELFLNQLDCSAQSNFASLSGLRVSAHLLINRRGQLTQYVPFIERAWHAGQSTWQGRENCNDFALGIELEGTDEVAYTPVQYDRLVEVLALLITTYPNITTQRVTGHSDISPDRKTDPGPAFNWPALRRRLATFRGSQAT